MFNKRSKLTKRLMQVSDAEDVVRSHAYSRVAGQSRAVPVRRTPSRGQAVPGYRDSMVGSVAQYREKVPPRPTAAGADTSPVSDQPIIGNRPASGTQDKGSIGADSLQRRHHFIEPPKRNFNRFN